MLVKLFYNYIRNFLKRIIGGFLSIISMLSSIIGRLGGIGEWHNRQNKKHNVTIPKEGRKRGREGREGGKRGGREGEEEEREGRKEGKEREGGSK